jgi:capsid assembly protease
MLARTAGRAWAIRPEVMDSIAASLRAGVVGFIDFEEHEQVEADDSSVAVVPLYGMITPYTSLMGLLFGGGVGLDVFRARLQRAVEDRSVKEIVIDVDSPGGLVDMVPETAKVIREAREVKRITAVANTVAASAAYWLASQADELVLTPSGEIGSIGVYMLHVDESEALEQVGLDVTLTYAGKYKTEGNSYQPLSAEARKHRQAKVDYVYELFAQDVAAGRSDTVQNVKNGYGQGRTLQADEAVSSGLADRIATLDEVVGGLEEVDEEEIEEEAAEDEEAAAADDKPEASDETEDETVGNQPAIASSRQRRLRELELA